MQKRFLSFVIGILALGISACEETCYDAQMAANHPGVCLQDCPEVCGCDGKTYCNECIANSQGIAVVKNEACR